MIKIGSLFAGIGGFELGLERAIPNSETIWQVEQEPFCQKVLKKHWPNATIYDDVRTVGSHNLESVDILCGGFPCQDISVAGKGKGIEGEKSGLWFEMLRIIRELRPRIAVMENVPIITSRGLSRVLGGLSEVGYDAEWNIISARQFGAPHLRKRWFCVAYPNSNSESISPFDDEMEKLEELKRTHATNTSSFRLQRKRSNRFKELQTHGSKKIPVRSNSTAHWTKREIKPVLCGMDDGLSPGLHRTKRLKALGNAIVPQCSEYIGLHILNSGLLDDLS